MDQKKATIFALSFLTIISTDTVAPLVQQIYASFPQVNPTLVKMTITLPSLMTIFFGLIAGQLVKRFSKKTILIFGLALYSVGGISAGWMSSFNMHLLMRALVGAGTGLISPVITSLIADYFEGKERADMVGYSFGVSHFAAVITPALAVYVGAQDWRTAFFIFLVVPLVLIFTMIFLPNDRRRSESGKIREKAHIPGRAILCAIVAMFMMILFFIVITDLPYLLDTKMTVSPFLSMFGLSTCTLGATIGGLAFSQVYLKLKKWAIPVSLFVSGTGYLLAAFGQANVLILIGLLSVGLGIGILISIATLITTNSVGEADSTAAVALTNAGFSIGIFLSPFFYANLPHFVNGMETAEVNFSLAGAVFTLVGMIALIVLVLKSVRTRTLVQTK